MTQPILSVEQEGYISILRLCKHSETPPVVKKVLKELSPSELKSDLSQLDLERFRETVGSVDVLFEISQCETSIELID
jgi:hypothetical protein